MGLPKRYQTPSVSLLLMAFVMPLIFSTWMALINNFSKEAATFTGKEIGILQSLREIPGFLAFTVVCVLLIVKEQRLAIWSLLVLAVGGELNGVFSFNFWPQYHHGNYVRWFSLF
jgi:hypothetical protein